MTKPPLPYILNVTERTAHRRVGLTESCNTDQITKRRNAQYVPTGYKRCALCHASYAEESPYSESNAGFKVEP